MGSGGQSESVLAALEEAPPMFVLPPDDLIPTLVPAIGASVTLDCMMGFFASSSLAEIAPGLATFLSESQAPMRLLVSPFITAADQSALKEGLNVEALAGSLFPGTSPDADELALHTLKCLTWLIREGRLEMRFAFLKDGLFHPKVWVGTPPPGQSMTICGGASARKNGMPPFWLRPPPRRSARQKPNGLRTRRRGRRSQPRLRRQSSRGSRP